ncbi:MAG TPA: polyhydroxyalkanoate granule-associated phasin [Burkholderiaceae bacterium]|nr:polyhydroxyalkanoate granule-associated phasin [Burkholderiaceae bacterium]
MPARHHRHAQTLATKTAELALAAPQVVAQRLARMAVAGPLPSARDRREFQRMGAEKATAFAESWNAMAQQAARANQALVASFWRAAWSPWMLAQLPANAALLQSAALGVLSKGLAPVHRTATANAKRLGRRTKPR